MTEVSRLLADNKAYAAARANVRGPTSEPSIGGGDLYGRSYRRVRRARVTAW